MKICERCGKEHDGSFGTGRFCSMKCAHSRVFTDEQKKNISSAMSYYHKTHEIKHPKFLQSGEFICKRCGKKHDGSYGTGKYCSSYCQHNTIHNIITFYEDNDNRVWKEIPFAPTYYVSNFGEVSKLVNGCYAKVSTAPDKRGYIHVTLCVGGKKKRCQVHRLVLMTFDPIDNPETMQVNHKDEVKNNNSLSNLEWCTGLYNIRYGTGQARSAEAQMKRVMCVETGIIYKSLTEASNQNSIKLSNLSACCNGKIKTCNGLHWKYIDEN